MHFQYITELYKDNKGSVTTARIIGEWLRVNVGEEGSAREPSNKFDWAWSLTSHSHGSAPVGIYFVRPEDKTRFRLSFGIRQGRSER
jgi:hypothetical protein